MTYAFDEFGKLVSSLDTAVSDRDNTVRYLCALVAELAYYHVPAFEVDKKRRAKIVPCLRYSEIVKSGTPTDVLQFIPDFESMKSFVAVDRNIIAVGILLNEFLFIGFRGTKFFYDWKINFRTSLNELNSTRGYDFHGQVHRGFAEEAVRISARILDAMADKKIKQNDVKHFFFSGHSLGGAVAALAENIIPRGQRSTCIIFGAPRYCNVSAYYRLDPDNLPTQIQRPGDMVPFVPPRRLGYADHPNQFDTEGNQIEGPIYSSGLKHSIWRITLFLGKWLEPHSMEAYRQELGIEAKASLADKLLVNFEKLKRKDVK